MSGKGLGEVRRRRRVRGVKERWRGGEEGERCLGEVKGR